MISEKTARNEWDSLKLTLPHIGRIQLRKITAIHVRDIQIARTTDRRAVARLLRDSLRQTVNHRLGVERFIGPRASRLTSPSSSRT